MKLFSKMFLGLALVAFLAMPTSVIFAEEGSSQTSGSSHKSVADLQAMIKSIQDQIAHLKAGASKTEDVKKEFCVPIARILKFGDKGEDVKVLNDNLEKEGFRIEGDRMMFSSATMKAVNEYQNKHRDAILTKNGLSSPTGIVGMATREKLNKEHPCAPTGAPTIGADASIPTATNISGYPITILYPKSSTNFKVNETFKISWTAGDVDAPEFQMSVYNDNDNTEAFYVGKPFSSRKDDKKGTYAWRNAGFMKKSGNYTLMLTGTNKSDMKTLSQPLKFTVGAGSSDASFAMTGTSASDLNKDGKVDGADLGLVLGAFGVCSTGNVCVADLNLDKSVDQKDVQIVLSSWTH